MVPIEIEKDSYLVGVTLAENEVIFQLRDIGKADKFFSPDKKNFVTNYMKPYNCTKPLRRILLDSGLTIKELLTNKYGEVYLEINTRKSDCLS